MILVENEKYVIFIDKDGQKGMTCKRCNFTTYHKDDIYYKYCHNCYMFIETLQEILADGHKT